MNKLAALLPAVAIAGVIWFFASSKPVVHTQHVHQSLGEGEEFYEIPHGKVLYVVVDKDGVYLGTQRFDLAGAKTGVAALLKEQQIKNIVIYGTDLARYGDVIELYGSIDPSHVRWSTFSFRSLPIGARKPLTGFLKPMCCFADDIENKEHDEP